MNKYKIFFFLLSLFISLIFLKDYQYNKFYFILLSIFCNAYFIISFSKKINLFHLFNSFFLWMGFWVKILVVHTYFDLIFAELNTEIKDYLYYFEESILVSIIGISAFFFSSVFNLYYSPLNNLDKGILPKLKITEFILKYQNFIILFFFVFVLIINLINYKYSIYQKGVVGNEDISNYLTAIFKWLLILGLTSFSSIIIFHSLLSKNLQIRFLVMSLFENFITSISLLSRGMFVNSMAIFFGIIKFYQFNKLKHFKKSIIIYLGLFIFLFLTTLYLAKELRTKKLFLETEQLEMDESIPDVSKLRDKSTRHIREILHLISHRFVGFEGVLAVSSYENKNFNFLKKTFFSKNNNNYEYSEVIKNEEIINSQSMKENTFFIKVPGIIAYLYYSGSLIFIFIACFFIGILFSYFERLIIKFSNGNIIFASLTSQVLAYRLSNFGYMPQNTYLIIITIILNLLIIYCFYLFTNKLNS